MRRTSAQAKEPGQRLAVDGGELRQLDGINPAAPPPRPRQRRRLPRRNAGAYASTPQRRQGSRRAHSASRRVPALRLTGAVAFGIALPNSIDDSDCICLGKGITWRLLQFERNLSRQHARLLDRQTLPPPPCSKTKGTRVALSFGQARD